MQRLLVHFLVGHKRGQCEVFPLGRLEQLSFGRDPRCDVRFDALLDVLVSRNHATLEWEPGHPPRFTITDLLSSNGTFVNGQRIHEPAEVRHGDVIEFGRDGPAVRLELDIAPARPGITASIPKIP